MRTFLIKSIAFLVVLAVVLEVFFSFVIRASDKPAYYQDPDSKLVLFDRSYRTSGCYTWGRLPLAGGNWVLNEAGWLSMFEYKPAAAKTRPRVALIGDSYIAGLSTDPETHVDALLHDKFDGHADFYSFGMGGQYLEQYRVLTRHIIEQHDPDVLVYFVNGRDIKSSLTTFGRFPLYFQLRPEGEGFAPVDPDPYREGRLRRLARRSSLVRYLRVNAGITAFGAGRGMADVNANPELQARARDEAEDSGILARAAAHIMDRLVAEHPDKTFIFVGDGRRNLLYEGQPHPEPYADCLVIAEAAARHPQCHYVDLMGAFEDDYATTGRMFNFKDNFHWNEYGCTVVARTVADFLEGAGLLVGAGAGLEVGARTGSR